MSNIVSIDAYEKIFKGDDTTFVEVSISDGYGHWIYHAPDAMTMTNDELLLYILEIVDWTIGQDWIYNGTDQPSFLIDDGLVVNYWSWTNKKTDEKGDYSLEEINELAKNSGKKCFIPATKLYLKEE